MTKIMQIRTAIINLYQKGEMIIRPVLKFMLYILVLLFFRNLLGYDENYEKLWILFVFALLAAISYGIGGLAISMAYMVFLLYPISVYMAGIVLFFTVLFNAFFYRALREYSYAVTAMPLLLKINMPFALAIGLGLFAGPISIIPMAVGVFIYYLAVAIHNNILVIEQVDIAESPMELIRSVLDTVIDNKAMWYTILVFACVILFVSFVKKLKIDNSFLVATVSGSLISMIGFLLSSLKCDIGMQPLAIVIFSILSAVLAGLAIFIYRPLSYHYSENVTFEDDDYFYYVKAVPKIKVADEKISMKNFSKENEEQEE